MSLTRALPVFSLLLVVAAPVTAQLRPNRPDTRAQALPRMLVATPFAQASADSAAAVRIGEGLRRRFEEVAGRWFSTISRDQMNEALLQYAYPADAVLPPLVARTLGTQLQARFLVTSSLSRGEGGRYVLQVRAAGINDRAGFTTSLMQREGQPLEDFGRAAADALSPAFRALEDARNCWERQTTRPQDAIRDAQRALRTHPDNGFAAFCLAEIAAAQGAPVDSQIALYRQATTGDQLSLEAWGKLADLYLARNDSVNTVRTFQQMLRVFPTNQQLREQAFRLFLTYGQPDAAKEVAEEGLAIDPANAELWDLKSNACLFLDDFDCAVDALERVYAIEPAKADSGFFYKITVAASQKPDTARLLKWAQMGVGRYPDSPTLLSQLVTAYGYAGPVDSSMAVLHRLMAVDSSDLRPVLRAIQAFGNAGRWKDAQPLVAYIQRLGDEHDQDTYARMLYPVVQDMWTRPEGPGGDIGLAYELSEQIVQFSVPGGQVNQVGNFFLGLSLASMVQNNFNRVQEERSCEGARQSAAWRDRAEEALTIGQGISPPTAAQFLQGLAAWRPTIQQQIRAYCR
jgi:tetratricopeptide (TPR) repeat protein